jgi:hypothetical protein
MASKDVAMCDDIMTFLMPFFIFPIILTLCLALGIWDFET